MYFLGINLHSSYVPTSPYFDLFKFQEARCKLTLSLISATHANMMEESCGVAKDGDCVSCAIPTILQEYIKAEPPPIYPIILSDIPDKKGACSVWSPPPGAEAKTFFIQEVVPTNIQAALDDWIDQWNRNGFETRLCRRCEEDPRSHVIRVCSECDEHPYVRCSHHRLWVWKRSADT